MNPSTQTKLQEELELLHLKHSLALQASQIGIWDWDIINNGLVWDDQMYILYGITKNTFSGVYEAWSNGLHPEDRKRGEEELQNAVKGIKEFDTEFRVIWPDKSIHHIKARGVIVKNPQGQPIRMYGANWDITEFKTQALDLREIIDDLEKYKKISVNRELKMIELKQKVKFLEEKICDLEKKTQ